MPGVVSKTSTVRYRRAWGAPIPRCWPLAQTAAVLSARRCTRTSSWAWMDGGPAFFNAHDQLPEIRHCQVRGEDRASGGRLYGTLCSEAFGLHAYRFRLPTVDPSRERGWRVSCRGSND